MGFQATHGIRRQYLDWCEPENAYRPVKATGRAINAQGQPIIATADQSIQAGDGGTGFAIDIQAYKRTYFHSELYFAGVYLFNPGNTNGVSTFRRLPGEQVMSVMDQYLYRGGIGHAVPKIRGLAGSIGGRIEGVPVRDVFGRSDGFRRPGYRISVDPGFLYARGSYTFSCNVPWAVERNRKAPAPKRPAPGQRLQPQQRSTRAPSVPLKPACASTKIHGCFVSRSSLLIAHAPPAQPRRCGQIRVPIATTRPHRAWAVPRAGPLMPMRLAQRRWRAAVPATDGGSEP